MKIFDKFFDDFIFHARVMPVLTELFPIGICGIINGVIKGNHFDYSLYIFSIAVFLVFTSKIAREKGRNYEQKMYKELGGLPTTIVLRFSNNMLDNITKIRYHKILNKICSGICLPLNISEESSDSDEMYISAINYLRNYANSNRETHPRVYQELKEYNYWRNLYGGKYFTLLIYTIICVREVVVFENFNIKDLFGNPYPEYIALWIMILSSIIICIFVNKTTVKRRAFDYAKALVEICETIKISEE